GVLGIYAGMAPKHVQEVVPLVFEELQKLAHNFSDVELNRAKQQLKASQMMYSESVGNRCEQLAHHMMVFGRPLAKEEIIQRIEAVQLEDVKELVNTVVQSQYTLTSIGETKSMNHLEKMIHNWRSNS